MAASTFEHFELRTTDPESARAFYADVFGPRFWQGHVSLARLPVQAVARGAPPHWLGELHVDDVCATVARFAELGAQPLGPVQSTPDGTPRAILRDPVGAVVALSARSATPPSSAVWHLLSCRELERAFAAYTQLFGWTATETHVLGPERWTHRWFAWNGSGTAVGAVTDMARSPTIHTQWLFFFPVGDIDAACARVRAQGGLALPVVQSANGDRLAPCDDPQGAAFGLCQRSDA